MSGPVAKRSEEGGREEGKQEELGGLYSTEEFDKLLYADCAEVNRNVKIFRILSRVVLWR
jgi:hypothetical protein